MTEQTPQEKLNEAITVLNKHLQEINIRNMNVELVAQMFKNYQSNVLFHLEGELLLICRCVAGYTCIICCFGVMSQRPL